MDHAVADRPFDRDDDLRLRSFSEALVRAQGVVGAQMDAALPEIAEDALRSAMRYALVGGKALRAFLVLESARINGVTSQDAAPVALAIECIHAYSLVHDDLPCMDDDDLRRGQPTVHKKWDEHTAVLAGDALQAQAFELLASAPVARRPGAALALTRSLAIASGASGMVGGQMMDIEAESSAVPYSLDQISAVQQGKTGALIRWSATAGATLADQGGTAQSDHWGALDRYGECLGLAFQIADDVLDVEGDAATVGKAVGKDAGRGKATFVSHLGLDGAKSRASDLVQQACDALSLYGDKAECLREAARFVISRRK